MATTTSWTLASDDDAESSHSRHQDSRHEGEPSSHFADSVAGGGPATRSTAPRRRPAPAAPASLAARLWALLLDGLLLMGLSAPLLWWAYGEAITRLDDTRALSLALNWALPPLYCLLFWGWAGATPGKLLAGIRIVDARSGASPGWVQSALRVAGLLLSALPLGLGFAAAALDAEHRGWHDRLAGTRVLRRRAATDENARGYFASHWHGEQGLAQSFWLNHVLLAVPLSMAVTGLMAWISLKGEALQAGSVAVLVGWPLLLLVHTWCIVGAWRSAGHYSRAGGSALWTLLARLSLGLGFVQLAVSALFGFLPQSADYLQMARGIDPIGQATFKLSADGRTLRLSGPIGMGDAGRLQALLGTAPEVRLFELVSPGGRLYEAERMVSLVKQTGGTTRAVGSCASACTVVFLAGAQRQLMPGARLGFHRASTGTYNALADEAANQQLAGTYRQMGLPEALIQKTLRTPAHSMWYPHSDELVAQGLIVAPPQTLDAQLPAAPARAALADFAEALRANPAWYQLETRFPDLVDTAARRMHASRQAGAEAMQRAAQQALAPRMPELILASPAELRQRYVGLLADQLRAARDAHPARCQALLAGQSGERRQLGAALAARESAWLIEAADTPPLRRLPSPPSELEREVMRRTVGELPIGMLAGVWPQPGARPPALDCGQVLQLLDRVAALPPPQRELAQRLLFQPARSSGA